MQAFLVHDPDAIKRVLMDNAANYRKDTIQRRILSSGLSDGLLSVEGGRWEVQRRTLAPIFSRRTVASFTAPILAAANELAEKWKRLGTGATIDVAAEMTLVTVNVLALTIFSDGIGGDLNDFRTAMNAYFGVIGRIGALDLFGVPKFVPRPGHRRLLRTMSYFESVIDNIIEEEKKACCQFRKCPQRPPHVTVAFAGSGDRAKPRAERSSIEHPHLFVGWT